MAAPLVFTVHGARGSTPSSGPNYVRHGGHTTCFSLAGGSDAPIVVDCGTGLVFAPNLHPTTPTHFRVFLTHYHLDHLLGLQSFRPFFEAANTFTFYGHAPAGMTIEAAVAGVFAGPWFPVRLEEVASTLEFVALGDATTTVGDVTVSSLRLHHPQGATGYRFDHDARSVVVATDHETGSAEIDRRLIEFASGADVLIHDAQYTPDEYASLHGGWGHSTWRQAAATATAAGVGRLVLTSHDPFRSDDEIDMIVDEARRVFPAVEAAHVGMTIEL